MKVGVSLRYGSEIPYVRLKFDLRVESSVIVVEEDEKRKEPQAIEWWGLETEVRPKRQSLGSGAGNFLSSALHVIKKTVYDLSINTTGSG